MAGQARETQLPPRRAADRGRGWYRGDLHIHSARSHGGQLTPGQLTAAARASGLDFIAVTEHNTTDTHGPFGQLAGEDLLVITGQEVVTQTGHWLALGTGPEQESLFVRVEVHHPGQQMAALTNPVFLS